MLKKITKIPQVSRGMIVFGGNGYIPAVVRARIAEAQKEFDETKQHLTSVSYNEKSK